MSHVCPTTLEIEGHSLRIIGSDSFDLQPVTVEKIISNAGERYDFVVDTNQCQGIVCSSKTGIFLDYLLFLLSNLGDYWIRVSGVGVCDQVLRLQQFAKLTYDQTLPRETHAFQLSPRPAYGTILNTQQRVSKCFLFSIQNNSILFSEIRR